MWLEDVLPNISTAQANNEAQGQIADFYNKQGFFFPFSVLGIYTLILSYNFSKESPIRFDIVENNDSAAEASSVTSILYCPELTYESCLWFTVR